jgi:signal transduction histidine kinase
MEAVLELSQLEAGSYDTDHQTIHLGPLVRRLADEFELQAKEGDIALDVEIDETPVEAYADETAVRRIVSNLLDNALKFTPEGGRVTVRARIDDAETAIVEVEDTGVGIGEEALSTVFEAFKQESEGLTREYEGAGLGLSIVHELVETLGGQIEVDSEKGVGTCITVHLPKTSGGGTPEA